MYELLWKAVTAHLSVDRMKADINRFYELSRWSSSDKIVALAQMIAARMEEAGLEDVRLIEAPADGRTYYGGWVIPKACDVKAARLILLSGDGAPEILVDYAENPTGLMVYSRSTPPEGITADVVIADSVEECQEDRVAGRLVLTSCIGIEFSQAAMRAGALGIICDGRFGHRFYKTGPLVDASNEWHNYTIPPWEDPQAGFGFSISPDVGQRLRARILAGETVRAHALVETHHYDGTLAVVSGRLPGLEAEEIALTGHYDEFGADDNCSQVAVGLEVVRAIRAMVNSGEMPPLKRSIRLLFPMEVRGFNALIQDPEETWHLRFGLNIDTVGTDQNAVTSICNLTENFAALPSFTEEFVAELLGRVAEGNPLFRWKRLGADTIDNIFGEPLIGAPTPCIYHYSATHHLALDTPARISGTMLQDMARVAATYCGFLANAGLEEALWLSEMTADHAIARMNEVAARMLRDTSDGGSLWPGLRQIETLHEVYSARVRSTRSLAPSVSLMPTPRALEAPALDDSVVLGVDRLLPREVHAEHSAAIQARLDAGLSEARQRIQDRAARFAFPEAGFVAAAAEAKAPLSQCVPLKTFRGFVSFEDASLQERAALKEMGIGYGWGAPMWLQDALMFANGRRTAGEIGLLLQRRSHGAPDVPVLERVFGFLVEREKVRLRPFLTQEKIKAALESAGLAAGDVVLGHFALSRFGYVEGGADGLIDTLLEILGPEGTLMMPTFAFAWVGNHPYDPAKSPSRVGNVTDRFWRRAGVLRSQHPTHSFAAAGNLASKLLDGHDHTQPPLGEDSPIAQLAAAGGKILVFARKEANTSMHVGEYIAGIPGVDLVCPVMMDGERREVIVTRCPWHVNFVPAYEQLYQAGLVRDTPLGEGTIHTMGCQDAIDAQAGIARATPELLAQAGCDCAFCKTLLDFCEARGR